ncbi:carbon-nitrogen hydrolase family protein [Candidatus Roizmanbacteria bacterium]|nr:carbon-nitrogen hydrolase family protein [Candidatus Roizmanbacteria bacterium]
MKVRIVQLVVTKDIPTNSNKIFTTLEDAQPDEWVLFPEGVLSGYYPEEKTFLDELDPQLIENEIEKIHQKVKQKNVVCLFGTAMKMDDYWYNSTVLLTPEKRYNYQKNNLSTLDRDHFKAGSELKVFEIAGIKVAIQMCRELTFPEQWKILKKSGVQVIFHINNAIKENDKLREKVLVSRAFENQVWVCSVNNAASPQTMSSMIIDPYGKEIWLSVSQKEEIHTQELDLSLVSTQYLQQERTDLVNVASVKPVHIE